MLELIYFFLFLMSQNNKYDKTLQKEGSRKERSRRKKKKDKVFCAKILHLHVESFEGGEV